MIILLIVAVIILSIALGIYFGMEKTSSAPTTAPTASPSVAPSLTQPAPYVAPTTTSPYLAPTSTSPSVAPSFTQPAPTTFQIKSKLNRDFCLVTREDSPNDGVQFITWGCDPNAKSSQFKLENNKLVNGFNKCIAPFNNTFDNNNYFIQTSCNDTDAQKWTLDDSGRIKAMNQNKCLDVPRGRIGNGVIPVVWDCHTGNNQIWEK